MREVNHDNRQALRDLFIGRRVVAVHDNNITLDDDHVVTVEPNDGCGGCTNGRYTLERLAAVDNIITNIRVLKTPLNVPDDGFTTEYRYQLFVFAGAVEMELLSVAGDDGNGYYGTGYWLEVNSTTDTNG